MAISFLQLATDTDNDTSYTFAAQNLGTAAADRYIIVAINGTDGGVGGAIDTVTIGGVSATIVTQAAHANGQIVGFAIANVPTGTSGDIVVNFDHVGDTSGRCAIAAYRVDDLDSPTPVDSDSADGTGTSNASVTLTTDTDGFVIAAASGGAGTHGTFAWTNVTEDFDSNLEATVVFSGGSVETSGTSLAITADNSGDGSFGFKMLAIAWAFTSAVAATPRRRTLLGVGK